MLLNELQIRAFIYEKLKEARQKSVRADLSRRSNSSTSSEGVLQPDSSASIKGKEFIVHGVKFQSVPAEGAGNIAVALYQSAEKAGQKAAGKGWETTPGGRSWISKNIYDASKSGSGAQYAKLLGTDKESYWSSWFFSVCYKGFAGEGGHGSNHFDYGADEGMKRRKDILENPENYVGKTAFVTFAPNEAPVFKGDSVFGFRSGSGSKFSDIASGKPSHMRIFGDDGGTVYGGNESNRVGKGKVKMSGNRTISGKYGKEPYVAVYKRVKVIGKAGSENTEKTDAVIKNTEKTNVSDNKKS